jgi:hypothetical protein
LKSGIKEDLKMEKEFESLRSLLTTLFGGGIDDWIMISKTKYDWDNVITRLKIRFGRDEYTFNDLVAEIFEMAKDDFCRVIDEYILENQNNEEKQEIVEKLQSYDFDNDENWDIYCNCLDNRVNLLVEDEEMENLLNDLFEKELDEIADKIGFNCIEIEQ